jgi:hypothetical protein
MKIRYGGTFSRILEKRVGVPPRISQSASPMIFCAVNGRTPLSQIRYSTTNAIKADDHQERHVYNGHHVELSSPPEGDWRLYRYNELSPRPFAIRLVEILPGETEAIHCLIHETDLGNHTSQHPTFDALSYEWGSEAFETHICCDGMVIPVTQNLHSALRHLRNATTRRLAWIDALCINQADVLERSRQTALMSHIFRCARQVVAWLGAADKHTERAFSLIEAVSSSIRSYAPGGSFKGDARTIWDKKAMAKMNLPRCPSPEWEALARLFERQYFRRLWVVQELVVSPNAVVWCGSFSLGWAQVEHVASLIISTGWMRALQELYGVTVRPSFIQTIRNCKLHFHETRGGSGMGLAFLLCSTRRFQTSDPRDKIIALIGLTRDAEKYSNLTNYSRSIAELYLEVTGELILADQSLLLLSSVEDQSDRRLQALPSWVPDYSVWRQRSILGLPIRHSRYGAATAIPTTARWSPGSFDLHVDGVCHDQIEAVTMNSLDNSATAHKFVLQCLGLSDPLLRRGTVTIDSIWRTLIGNTGGNTYPAPEMYRIFPKLPVSFKRKEKPFSEDAHG